jgi:galactose oxidase
MNWYGTDGDGSHVIAGSRSKDPDSMNRNAVMYDSVNGKILSLGGSQSYAHSFASQSAHIITISKPFHPPTVEAVQSMHYPRLIACFSLLDMC